MALIPQVVPLSLGIGLDTKTDPKQVVSTKLLSLQNVVFGTGGEFKKRNGYNSLNSISAGNAIASFQNQLVALDGENLNSYSANQKQFNAIGEKVSVDISRKPLVRQSGNAGFGDLAYANGLYAMIYSINNILVVDSVTGQVLYSDQIGGTGNQFPVKTQVLGNNFIFVYTTTSTIGYLAINTSNPTAISFPVVLQTNYAGTVFDCQTINGILVFTYANSSNEISNFYLNTALVKSSTITVNAHATALGLFADSSFNVWVGNSVATGGGNFTVNYFVLSPNLSAVLLAQTNIDTLSSGTTGGVPNITGIYDGSNGNFFYESDSPLGLPSQNLVKTATYSITGTQVDVPTVMVRSVSLYSKPFKYGSNFYMVVSYSSDLQPTFFVVDQRGIVVSKFAVGTAAETASNPILIDVVQLSSTEFTFSYAETDAIDIGGSNGSTNPNQDGISQLFLSFNAPTVTANIGQNLQLSGGILTMYDGVNAVEHGFSIYPENIDANVSTTGGHLSAGSYEYSVTYEWTDAQGQLHRSAPSVGLQVTTTGTTSSVTLELPTLRLTQKQNVLIVVYRTLVNGTEFYQVTPAPADGTAIVNDPTVDFIYYTDTLSDSSIQGNTQLYTNGGEFENIEIPATSILWTYQNRLLGVYSEYPTTIGYSKQVIGGSNSVPVEFNDSLTIVVPETDGAVTAGIQMDDKNIIFKQNTIFYMVGQGPSSNGQNNDFTTPQIISTDCGCVDKKSVVLMPNGVMFKSTKGIYLLDRSLQVHYVGADVEAYNSNNITSAQMLEGVNQIRFTLDSGIALVFDYYYNQWAVFSNLSAVDSCIFQGLYTYLSSAGLTLQESIGTYTDNGAFIPISFTTSWFSFAKIQGFQRAWEMLILGDYYSPHTLQVQLAINFNPSIVQTAYIPVLSSLIPYQNRFFLQFQKCQSYQITITEQQTAPYGQGLDLSALTFLIGGKKGLYKMPAAQSYG